MNLNARYFFSFKKQANQYFLLISICNCIFKYWIFFMFRKNDCSYQLTTFPGRLTLSLILKIVFVATATNFMLWDTLLSPKDKAGQSARCTGITHYRGLVQMQCPFRSGEGPETAFPTSPRLCQHCWPTHCKEGDLSKKISNQWPIPRYSV